MLAVRTLAGLTALLALTNAGLAATSQAKTSAPARKEAARPCTIGSFKGTMLPGSNVCVRVGGFVRYETGTTISGPSGARP